MMMLPRSGARYLVLVLLVGCWTVLPPVAGALGGCSYGYTSKSIAQAYLECLQYLNISRQPLDTFDETDPGASGNCLVRCIGLTTRWWTDDDEHGVREPALLRHFRNTAPTATQLEQARQCVIASSSSSSDRCRAAYQSFRCYSDQLGELVAHPRFLPPRTDELLGAVSECAELLQLSDERVALYVASSFLRDSEGTRLLRCLALRLGLYSDSKGVLSERLALLPGQLDDPASSWSRSSSPSLKAKQCETSVRDLGVDVCRLAAHSIEHCYGREAFGELWPLMMARYAPDGVVPDSTSEYPAAAATAAVRSKLVYLRKLEEQATGGAVPFEMVIADSDYHDIARLLESEPNSTPTEEEETDTPATSALLEPVTELSVDAPVNQQLSEPAPLAAQAEQEQARKPRSDSTNGDECGRDKCPDRTTL